MDTIQEEGPLVKIANERSRKVELLEIAKWLDYEIEDCNRQHPKNRFKFRKKIQMIKGRHECLMDMAKYFLREV